MDGRRNTSSCHAGDTPLVGLLHQYYAYCGDSSNVEGYLNKELNAVYVNIKAIRFVHIEQIIRALLQPYWKQGDLSRDVYKIITKYLSASERKIFELVQERFGTKYLTSMKNFIVGGKRLEAMQKENEEGNVGIAEVDKSSKSNNNKEAHYFKISRLEKLIMAGTF